MAAYNRLLNESGDVEVQGSAAQGWCDWEDALVSLEPGWSPSARFHEPDFRLQFARIVAHFFHNGAWLDEGQLLRDAFRLAGIPGVLIHGQRDIGGPVDVPWLLSKAWPDADLHVIHDGGHQGNQRMMQLILEAGRRFEDAF